MKSAFHSLTKADIYYINASVLKPIRKFCSLFGAIMFSNVNMASVEKNWHSSGESHIAITSWMTIL